MPMILVLLALVGVLVLVAAATTRGFDEHFEIRNFRGARPVPRRCIHCGEPFDLNRSEAWRQLGQRCTCNHCFWAGQRDADAVRGRLKHS